MLHDRVGNGQYFALPFFELDRFNDEEKHSLSFPDVLLTSSKWGQEIIKDQTGRPSEVVPMGVDQSIFYPTKKQDGPYIFLNIGKWEVRKGHDILGDMFSSTFGEKDDVELWLMPNAANHLYSKEEIDSWVQFYSKNKLASKIKILPPVATHKELAQIMNMADCGVFPTRAEGWNLEPLEMMACGKPIITTDYSAQTEYLTQDTAIVIPPDGMEEAYDGKWFTGQGDWAELGDEYQSEFAGCMRHCYEKRITPHTSVETASKFSWDAAADKLIDIFSSASQIS
jgi:hypothetical protein